MMNSFSELFKNHQGKTSLKCPLYLKVYDEIFPFFKYKPVNILEIGVAGGGSLEIYSKYFTNAKAIIGCDIRETCGKLLYDDTRVKIVIGDATLEETKAQIVKLLNALNDPYLDIIIDDGSHRSGDIVKTFCIFYPLLRNGGIYIIEDLHCSYWKRYEGDIFYPFSSISFLKSLIDVINYENWRASFNRKWILLNFASHYNVSIDEHDLSTIHSIQFFNSLCLITKKPPEENILGGIIRVGAKLPEDTSLESVISLLKARPVTPKNISLIGRFWEKVDPTLRELLYEQLPAEVNQLAQFAHIAEREKLYVFAEDCWRKISSLQPNKLHAKLMFAVMPRGYGNLEESKKRFEEALNYQLSNKILNRTTIIQHFINKFGYKTYIEIGVAKGLNFFQIKAPLKIGVDPNFVIPGELTNTESDKFYKLTSDEFFANPPKEIVENGIDIAFIDGLHTYEQSLRDVENCLKYLNPQGIIVMHDCLPASEAEAMPSLEEARKHPEFKGAWTGDVYKTIIHLRATRPDLFVAVVNVDCGVGIVKPGEPENMLDLSLDEIRNFTFEDFVKNKEHLLNLKPRDWFFKVFLV